MDVGREGTGSPVWDGGLGIVGLMGGVSVVEGGREPEWLIVVFYCSNGHLVSVFTTCSLPLEEKKGVE